jgi:Lar family restriction alleviation protein
MTSPRPEPHAPSQPGTASELLPCPFCAKSAHICDTGVFWVACDECDAEGPFKDNDQDAIKAWNTRSPSVDAGAREALEALSMWVTAKRQKFRVAGGMPAGGFDNMTPIEVALAEVESEIDRRAAALDKGPALDRKTFTVPDGFEAVRDAEGRATGEVRPQSFGVHTEPVAWRIEDGEGDYNIFREAPTQDDIDWATRYGRKYEPLYLSLPDTARGREDTTCYVERSMVRIGVIGTGDAALLAYVDSLPIFVASDFASSLPSATLGCEK